MWPYWLMFLVPAFVALSEMHRAGGAALTPAQTRLNQAWWGVFVLLTLLIGYRYEVGGDWGTYLRNFESSYFNNVFEALTDDDPGYRLLEFLAIEFNWGMLGVNLVGAAIFSFGLAVFCRDLPRPWLALAVAIPYLVMIVAMGYTRQGIAIGCAMVGLVALGRQQFFKFLIWVFLAATFHKSAVLLIPIAGLAAVKRKLFVGMLAAATTALAYNLMLEDAVEGFTTNYLEAEYQSEGAFVRLAMNALPAALLLAYRQRFAMSLPQEKLWRWFAFISLGLFILLYFSPSSTAVDRVGLYMLPLQLVVFSYFPEVFGRASGGNKGLVAAVLLYYATVEFVWLNFATHAFAWLPYRFYPFVVWFGA
jgi:hypothetical protein